MERYRRQTHRIRHSAAHVMAQAVLGPGARSPSGRPSRTSSTTTSTCRARLPKRTLWRSRRACAGSSARTRHLPRGDGGQPALFHDQPYKLELIDGLEQGNVDEYGEKTQEPVKIDCRQDTFETCAGAACAEHARHQSGRDQHRSRRPLARTGAATRARDAHASTARPGDARPTEYLGCSKRRRSAITASWGRSGPVRDRSLVGKGCAVKPKGAILRETLERFLRQAGLERGYEPVVTPHRAAGLYRTSGHYPYYKDSQYTPIDVDGEEYLLAVNCPHHIMITRASCARTATCRSVTRSSARSAATRRAASCHLTRAPSRDDMHLFVTPEQLSTVHKGREADPVRVQQPGPA